MIQPKTRGAHGAPLVLLLLLMALAFHLAAADRSLHLEIGDPARRGRESPLVLDGITDTRSGKILRQQAMRQHLFEKKPSKRTRRLDGYVEGDSGDVKRVKRLLGLR